MSKTVEHQALKSRLHEVNELLGSNPVQAYTLAGALTTEFPKHPTGWSLWAVAARALGRRDEALVGFKRALAVSPQPVAADWHNLATVCEELGRHDEAEAAYRKALMLDANYVDSVLQLAGLLRNNYRLVEAMALLESAGASRGNHARLLYSLGNTLSQMGDGKRALKMFDAALTLEPDFAEAHFHRSVELLAQGDFGAGFEEYAWRWRIPQAQGGWPPFTGPVWQGEPLGEKVLLVWSEQGLGDNIQFVRYLGLLRQQFPNARLAYWCPQTLLPVFEAFASAKRIELLAREKSNPAQLGGYDWHVPLLGLPHILQTRMESIPGVLSGMIGVDEIAHGLWKQRIVDAEQRIGQNCPGLRVGLVYSGSGEFMHGERRNLALSSLTPWLDVPGVVWHSLQVGKPAGEIVLSAWQGHLIDWSHYLVDFGATAALVAHLDLVICVDTAVAHLAGSMGIKTWLLNRYAGCWRWLRDRDDSPWYPSLRLFTQSSPGDWQGVVSRVDKALRSEARNRVQIASRRLDEQGRMLRAEGRLDEAITCYKRALELVPEQWQTLAAKGFALRMKNDFTAAERCYREALSMAPHDAQTHYNLAIILLMQQRYQEGWPEYAWRWKLPGNGYPNMPGCQWKGESLAGRSIILFQEQGFGDAIQFLRYVPRIQALGAKVTLAVRSPLLRLFGSSTTASIVDMDARLPLMDFHASLLDIPRLLCAGEEAALACCLHADTARVAVWKKKVYDAGSDASARLHVGLVFRGNPGRIRNDHRSISSSKLAPLLRVQGVVFHLLQVDDAADDAALFASWPAVCLHHEDLTDFAETAALIENLDLVLTVDTGVAHLAAALGKPTWVMVCHDSDWRWQIGRDDSPWYPTVRLFRQSTPGTWCNVFDQVISNLNDYF